MNRNEHLQWCKDKALEYVDRGDLMNAMASFASDMTKHPDTANHPAIGLMFSLYLQGSLANPQQMRKFINDFN